MPYLEGCGALTHHALHGRPPEHDEAVDLADDPLTRLGPFGHQVVVGDLPLHARVPGVERGPSTAR